DSGRAIRQRAGEGNLLSGRHRLGEQRSAIAGVRSVAHAKGDRIAERHDLARVAIRGTGLVVPAAVRPTRAARDAAATVGAHAAASRAAGAGSTSNATTTHHTGPTHGAG